MLAIEIELVMISLLMIFTEPTKFTERASAGEININSAAGLRAVKSVARFSIASVWCG
jgi:hypothetical protein